MTQSEINLNLEYFGEFDTNLFKCFRSRTNTFQLFWVQALFECIGPRTDTLKCSGKKDNTYQYGMVSVVS